MMPGPAAGGGNDEATMVGAGERQRLQAVSWCASSRASSEAPTSTAFDAIREPRLHTVVGSLTLGLQRASARRGSAVGNVRSTKKRRGPNFVD